jgi:hypothetical protein
MSVAQLKQMQPDEVWMLCVRINTGRDLYDSGTRSNRANKLPRKRDLYVDLCIGKPGGWPQSFQNMTIDYFGRKYDSYEDFTTCNSDWRPQIYKDGGGELWCPHCDRIAEYKAGENPHHELLMPYTGGLTLHLKLCDYVAVKIDHQAGPESWVESVNALPANDVVGSCRVDADLVMQGYTGDLELMRGDGTTPAGSLSVMIDWQKAPKWKSGRLSYREASYFSRYPFPFEVGSEHESSAAAAAAVLAEEEWPAL